jgi:hypothetical protein
MVFNQSGQNVGEQHNHGGDAETRWVAVQPNSGQQPCDVCGGNTPTMYRLDAQGSFWWRCENHRDGHKRMEQQDRMLQHFDYEHLPPELQGISIPFHNLAHRIVQMLPMNAERTVALRKLLEAKDCAVRAKLYKEPKQ